MDTIEYLKAKEIDAQVLVQSEANREQIGC